MNYHVMLRGMINTLAAFLIYKAMERIIYERKIANVECFNVKIQRQQVNGMEVI